MVRPPFFAAALYGRHYPVPPLVVLAACGTAGGQQQRGEGVLSLREAGVERVIASPWPVSIVATRRLFTRFYTHFGQRATPATVLQQAKLEMQAEDPLYDAYYWSGFVVVEWIS